MICLFKFSFRELEDQPYSQFSTIHKNKTEHRKECPNGDLSLWFQINSVCNRKIKSRFAQSAFKPGVIFEFNEHNLHLLFQQSYHERSKLKKKTYLLFKNYVYITCINIHLHTLMETASRLILSHLGLIETIIYNQVWGSCLFKT